MRNTILILSLCFITFQSQAQLAFGLKGGVMSSNLNTENQETNTRTGASLGLFAQFQALPALVIQAEGLYQQKGSYDEEELFGITSVSEVKLDYLTVPVFAKLRLPVGETIFPNAFAGMYGAYALNGESVNTVAGTTFTNDLDINEVDFGLLFGGGVDIKINRLFLTADIRYSFGLVNVLQDNNILGVSQDYQNGSLSINFGVGVNIGD